jgi:hypothetical protein
MKIHVSAAAFARLARRVDLFVALIVLLFPSSASVICIAHGGSTSVQDINAASHRHMHFADSVQLHAPSNNAFRAADNSQDCTDIFMTPNGSGAVLAPFNMVPPSRSAAPAHENIVAADAPPSLYPPATGSTHLRLPDKTLTNLIPASSSLPMRC